MQNFGPKSINSDELDKYEIGRFFRLRLFGIKQVGQVTKVKID